MLEGLNARLSLAQANTLNSAGLDFGCYCDVPHSFASVAAFDLGFASVRKNEQKPPHMIATNAYLYGCWKEGRAHFIHNVTLGPQVDIIFHGIKGN